MIFAMLAKRVDIRNDFRVGYIEFKHGRSNHGGNFRNVFKRHDIEYYKHISKPQATLTIDQAPSENKHD